MEKILSKLRRSSSHEVERDPVELVGYHGGEVRGRTVYLTDDIDVAKRYGEPQKLFYTANNPHFVDTPEEFVKIDEEAKKNITGTHNSGHGRFAEWARSKGYDALVVSGQARAALGADGFQETLILEPERLRSSYIENDPLL